MINPILMIIFILIQNFFLYIFKSELSKTERNSLKDNIVFGLPQSEY
jgi:hypothetical protein